MDIHQRIRELRKKKDFSLRKIAAHCGVEWQAVQQWEKPGGTTPRSARLERLAEILETTAVYLEYGIDGPMAMESTGKTAEDWPFEFGKERFLALPNDARQRIETYAQGVIEQWEASSRRDRRKPG